MIPMNIRLSLGNMTDKETIKICKGYAKSTLMSKLPTGIWGKKPANIIKSAAASLPSSLAINIARKNT